MATAYDDAVWVGQRLAEVLPLALPVKQSLLELTDPILRLDRIAASMRRGKPRSERSRAR